MQIQTNSHRLTFKNKQIVTVISNIKPALILQLQELEGENKVEILYLLQDAMGNYSPTDQFEVIPVESLQTILQEPNNNTKLIYTQVYNKGITYTQIEQSDNMMKAIRVLTLGTIPS